MDQPETASIYNQLLALQKPHPLELIRDRVKGVLLQTFGKLEGTNYEKLLNLLKGQSVGTKLLFESLFVTSEGGGSRTIHSILHRTSPCHFDPEDQPPSRPSLATSENDSLIKEWPVNVDTDLIIPCSGRTHRDLRLQMTTVTTKQTRLIN